MPDKDKVIELAKKADPGFDDGPESDGTMEDSIVGIAAITRLIQLVRDDYRAELLAGSGEPVCTFSWSEARGMYTVDTPGIDKAVCYTADQLAAAVLREREECAKECERMVLFPGGRQEAPAHGSVWDAAKAIRARGGK